MKIVVILCEGAHDVAFLGRILENAGYKKFTKKIKELIEPTSPTSTIGKHLAKVLRDYKDHQYQSLIDGNEPGKDKQPGNAGAPGKEGGKKIITPFPSEIMEADQVLLLL